MVRCEMFSIMPPNILFQLGYVKQEDGTSRRQCLICKKWKDKWPATNMMNHFAAHHKAEHKKARAAKRKKDKHDEPASKRQRTIVAEDEKSFDSTSSIQSSFSTQILSSPRSLSEISSSSSILGHIVKANTPLILDKLALALVMNNIPHHTINNPYFIDLIKTIVSCANRFKIPDRRQLQLHIQQLGDQVKKVNLCVMNNV